MKVLLNTIFLIIITVLGLSGPAFAQDNTRQNDIDQKRSISIGIGFPNFLRPFEGRIGLGMGIVPAYQGADSYDASVMPLVSIRKPGHFFLKGASSNINDGLASAGVTLFHASYSSTSGGRTQFVMGPLVRANGGRDEADSDVLNGLGDIDQSAGVGGFMEIYAGALTVSATVSPQEVGDDDEGSVVALDLKYNAFVGRRLKVITGLSASWADDDYMQGYFGVTNEQANQTGLDQFDSNAGFKEVGLQLNAVYDFSPRWSLEGQVGYWRLLNDAADSPIVKNDGTADQLRGLVGISYRF